MQRIEARVDVIAGELRRIQPDGSDLAGGAAGVALFFSYRYLATGDDEDAEAATRFLEAALVGGGADSGPSLFSGPIGIAWTLAHLAGDVLDLGADDPNDATDEAVLDLLDGPAIPDFDLVSGLVGLGVYALERLPRPAAVAALERIVTELGRRAVPDSSGLAWKTGPDQMPGWQRDLAPGGYWNLGLAHGVPGVIAFLARVRDAGIAPGEATRLIDGSVDWLLARQHPATASSRFDAWIAPTGEARPARTAWCYGDPGVAVALLAAGRREEAADVARAAATRPDEETEVTEGGLCHGAAGLAIVFRRLAEGTGDDQLRAAAGHWLDRALSLPTPEAGFLEGDAGVGLALLSAVSDIAPAWDRVLLLSGPATYPAVTDG